jgi:hypothetical protein
MSTEVEAWVGRLPRRDIAALDACRLVPSLELCEEDDEVWVRIRGDDQNARELLAHVPWTATYDLLPGGVLRRCGHSLPEQCLPGGRWERLSAALQPELPAAREPGQPPGRVDLQLVNGGEWKSPNMLGINSGVWSSFVDTAASVRLKRLYFAQTGRDVIVRGAPLPPVPGTQFIEENGIAKPVGMRFSFGSVRSEFSAYRLRRGCRQAAPWCER